MRESWQWWCEGCPKRRFGVPNLRIVTVAPNARRRDALRKAAQGALAHGTPAGLYLFGIEDDVTLEHPARILERCWMQAIGTRMIALGD